MPEVLVVQFGGAAGTLEKLGDQAGAVRAALAAALGLGDAPQWQSQRDRIADLGGWLATTTGALGKLGQDVALMAQAGGEIGARRRRRLLGDAAQVEPGRRRGAGGAGAVQRRPGRRAAAGDGPRAGALGRRLDPRMAPPPPDADRDRSGPQDRPRSRRLHRVRSEAPTPRALVKD